MDFLLLLRWYNNNKKKKVVKLNRIHYTNWFGITCGKFTRPFAATCCKWVTSFTYMYIVHIRKIIHRLFSLLLSYLFSPHFLCMCTYQLWWFLFSRFCSYNYRDELNLVIHKNKTPYIYCDTHTQYNWNKWPKSRKDLNGHNVIRK